MKNDRERARLRLELEEIETKFFKSRRSFEEQEQELLYSHDWTNRAFAELTDATVHHLTQLQASEEALQTAMFIIEENKEACLAMVKQEQDKLAAACDDDQEQFRKQRDLLEEQMESMRREDYVRK